MGMGGIAKSGMQAAMSALNIISNNIANANSYGFKTSMASFADLMPSGNESAGSQIGIGVNLSAITQNFTSGNRQDTGIKSNMSIQGSGFFVLKNSTTGQMAYTRDGSFNFNKTSGYFLSQDNQRLQGFPAVNGVIPAGTPATDLHISTAPIPAQATNKITQSGVNLNFSDTAPAVAPFDPTNSNTYNLQSTATVYDSVGRANTVNFYYVKSSTALTWNVYAAIGSTVLNSATPGTLTFNNNGTLASQTTLNSLQFAPTGGAVTPQIFNADMTGISNFAANDAAGSFITNTGYPAGLFNDYAIDANGVVTASYSGNNQTMVVGQVALASFNAPQGLQNQGGASWSATTASGPAVVSPTNNGSNTITAQSLETSNVQMAEELVGLIDAQNYFQANAQVEQTYSQIMQTVTKL